MSKKRKKTEKINFKKLEETVQVLVDRYRRSLPFMNIFFCCPHAKGNHYIFQELCNFPISGIIVNEQINAIEINAEWEADEKLRYLLPKHGFDIEINKTPKVMEWDGILNPNQERIVRNLQSNRLGMTSPTWVVGSRVFVGSNNKLDIKLIDVHRINMYEWGFEMLSDTISIVAVRYEKNFPYKVNEEGEEETQLRVAFSNKNLSGSYFKFTPLPLKEGITGRWDASGNYEDDRTMDFDEVLEKLTSKNTTKDEVVIKVQRVGQRGFKNIIID